MKAILFGLFLHSSQSVAQMLSGPALFNRCYIHLTGKPVSLRNSVMLAIRQNKADALQECQKLLNKVSLSPDGYLSVKDDVEAQDILNNFQKFHRTWFGANTVDQIQEYGLETSRGTMDIYDSTEPSLAITRAAFANAGQYKDILTLDSGVIALRRQDANVVSRFNWQVDFPMRRFFGNNGGMNLNLFHFQTSAGFSGDSSAGYSTILPLPKIQVGELVGIKLNDQSAQVPNVSMVGLGALKLGSDQPGLQFSFDLYKTFGGGVLGSPIYFMMNFGHGRDLKANGSTKVPRRWVMASMQTFLCAKFPALRQSDIEQFYVSDATDKTAPFRKGYSCLQCHATLDQTAYTARNLTTVNSDFAEFSTSDSKGHAKSAIHVTSYKPEFPSVAGWPSEPVSDFHRQTPTGRLYFRSMSGQLIDRPISGISSLGQELTNTDDFYNCAAKRYFKFFTGIDVTLYDESDPNNSELNRKLSERDINSRKYIETLGRQLRQDQSVKNLIKNIMGSEYYRDLKFQPQ